MFKKKNSELNFVKLKTFSYFCFTFTKVNDSQSEYKTNTKRNNK